MNPIPFKAGGALTSKNTSVYIERQCDHGTLLYLRKMDYVMFIEPRQQGKTSLINYLLNHPALGNVTFVYIDVGTLDHSTEAAWYQTLCSRILHQLRRFATLSSQRLVIPQNSAGWREFLWHLVSSTDANHRLIIALDEIGNVTFPGATGFFSVLREVYNSRQAEPVFRQMTFMLSGAFHPRDLIRDDRISPFNIAQRVRLLDFTLDQVHALVEAGSWSADQASLLAERIYYWTNGQPYLSQLLCFYLDQNAKPADVDVQVKKLYYEEKNRLPPLLQHLSRDVKLYDYTKRILAGERVRFYPGENRRQAQLELLGVIKTDSDGYCAIRNRIYEQALT